MADIQIKIEGLDEIRRRMSQYPQQWRTALDKTMQASLLSIWEVVGRLGYPKRPVTKSKYVRTGTLGRSLGMGIGGQKQGRPDIYRSQIQGMDATGEFGTRLEYAPYVIGERQAWFHRLVWWTLPGTVLPVARAKIERLFKIMTEELAHWLGK